MEDRAMQATHPETSEAVERRAATGTIAVSPRPRARWRGRLVLFVLLGCALLAASYIGTGWLVNGNHGTDARSNAPPIDGTSTVGFGFVDVESGVINLAPTQPGKVSAVLVE